MSSRPSRGAARLAAILDALPDALLLVNCNGTVVNANTIALETFEAPGTALVGRGLLDLLPTFDSKLIPGSMRRPEDQQRAGMRTKPTRMVARRTDGSEFLVEVTSANLEDGRTPYESSFEAAYADHGRPRGYTGDELLMLVVRDLTGTQDTEAELARQQRQTEMILRAAAEGVVGVDTQGRVVLVNPAAAQILGYRASEFGGQELHPLIHHSRPDGSPLPYEETPLADTLRSGRKHRVRGQVLWTKSGEPVAVDMTTAPVRGAVGPPGPNGAPEEQLVGAVLTFTDRRAFNALAARHEQLLAMLQGAVRGPLEHLHSELGGLASDPAGQLWPEANQVLHHLAAGYGRMRTLVENVLRYQRLDAGEEKLSVASVALDEVVSAGVDGAVELIGPGRARFTVHAPQLEVEVDPDHLALALAHLIADVAGVDAMGTPVGDAAHGDGEATIVVAAARRGEVVRIEVRGPHHGGDPVHAPLVRGIVRHHGGVLQTHDVPGSGGGKAYVLEVPATRDEASSGRRPPAAAPARGSDSTGTHTTTGVRRQGADTDAGQDGTATGAGRRTGDTGAGQGTEGGATPTPGAAPAVAATPARPQPPSDDASSGGTALPAPRRGRHGAPAAPDTASPAAGTHPEAAPADGGLPDRPDTPHGQPGGGTPPGLTAVGSGLPEQPAPTGRRRGRPSPAEQHADLTGAGWPSPGQGTGEHAVQIAPGTGRRRARPAEETEGAEPVPSTPAPGGEATGRRSGRRARRALAHGHDSGEHATAPTPPGTPADRGEATGAALPSPAPGADWHTDENQQHTAGGQQPEPFIPQQAQPWDQAAEQPVDASDEGASALPPAAADRPAGPAAHPEQPAAEQAAPVPAGPTTPDEQPAAAPEPAADAAAEPAPAQQPRPARQVAGFPVVAASPILGGEVPPEAAVQLRDPQALPSPQSVAGLTGGGEDTGSGISVRTLGQGVPFAQQVREQEARQSDPRLRGRQGAPGTGPTHGGAPTPPATATPPQVPTQAPTLAPAQPQPQAAAQPQPQAAAQPPAPAPVPPPAGPGRRRKLATPQESERAAALARQTSATPVPAQGRGGHGRTGPAQPGQPQPGQPHQGLRTPPHGREFAIGAPDAGAAEGPEHLDGPGGAVEVTDRPHQVTPPQDDELPPEPLDNPRRLLVWPEPDVATQQALTDRGYRPVVVNSREEVDAQIAAYPAALFVDPLTGPITRTALQSLRTAAVAAQVPVLVTAGLGQATRDAAYGADPAVLLKALAPRDSEQHPPRVLLVEENPQIAGALRASLERRGMQVGHATSDAESMNVAAQLRPNLVVMDLMQVRRRRAGIIDWLRVNDMLNRTPFVVYTSAAMDPSQLHLLASGETVLFLAERSTSEEVQNRIVDLLTKIGAS